MKLATIRTEYGTRAVRIDGDLATELGPADVVDVLRQPDWRSAAQRIEGPTHAVQDLDYAPVVVAPQKIVCVGLNYRTHIVEMGRDLPTHPTLFAKYSLSLVGAYDDIVLPKVSDFIDWEAELGVVIGDKVRHASLAQARDAIAGYTVVNDVTVRDWQCRTPQWLQGKTFEATTPVGPWLVTDATSATYPITCELNGDIVQKSHTADLVFDAATLIAYVSSIITLVPGDLIATGTPGGVGQARRPPRYLRNGDTLVTRIEGVGECRNVCRAEAGPSEGPGT